MTEADYGVLSALMIETIGQLRHFVSAVGMINRFKTVDIVEMPATRRRHGKNWIGIPRRKSVSIDLGRYREEIRLYSQGEKMMRRSPTEAFDVRGHWVHFGAQNGCDHKWVDVESGSKRRQVCHCGAKRTWKKNFRKGEGDTAPKQYKARVP